MPLATELSPALKIVFWCSLSMFGLSALVFMACLNTLLATHHRGYLRALWVSGSLMVAAAIATLILLLHR